MFTARVADSYGVNPHEHKPSQDPFEAETAVEKQAETGDVECPGTSSSTSPTDSDSSDSKNLSDDEKPVDYRSPRPWMRKSDALVQVIDALMEAEMNQ